MVFGSRCQQGVALTTAACKHKQVMLKNIDCLQSPQSQPISPGLRRTQPGVNFSSNLDLLANPLPPTPAVSPAEQKKGPTQDLQMSGQNGGIKLRRRRLKSRGRVKKRNSVTVTRLSLKTMKILTTNRLTGPCEQADVRTRQLLSHPEVWTCVRGLCQSSSLARSLRSFSISSNTEECVRVWRASCDALVVAAHADMQRTLIGSTP